MTTRLQIERVNRIERRIYRMIDRMTKFDRNRQTAISSEPEKVRYWSQKVVEIHRRITDTIKLLPPVSSQL